MLTYQPDGVTLNTEDRSLRYLPVRVDKDNANWDNNGALFRYWPAASGNWQKMWGQLLHLTQEQIYTDLAVSPYFPEVPFTWDGTTAVEKTGAANKAYRDLHQPRLDCRVRFFPFAENLGANAMLWPNATVPTDLQKSYESLLRQRGTLTATTPYGYPIDPRDNGHASFNGFVPAYNYFGCCNDPNNDNRFDDLICQPFKKVRDATEKFLDHVDFVRGDRVAFVTFDRSAYLIDPDGSGTQTAMITSQPNAVSALRRLVGIRAEPDFYADTDADGKWDSFVTGGAAYVGGTGPERLTGGNPIDYGRRFDVKTQTWHTGSVANDLAGYNNTQLGFLTDYPVAYNCFLQNATLSYPFSLYSAEPGPINFPTYGSLLPYTYDAAGPLKDSRFPNPLGAATSAIMNPPLNDTNWDKSMQSKWPVGATPPVDYARLVAKATFSYELRAGCGGNNVGAALRKANDALLDPNTARTGNTGAVWVMVLLGDGAAGASDPVMRNGAALSNGDPYGSSPSDEPKAGTYGGYGLCPYGTYDNQMGLTSGWTTVAPRCSDDGSETSNGGKRGIMGVTSRHFCEGSAVGGPNNDDSTVDILKTGKADCVTKYDVDDYARDWADFVGLKAPLPLMSPFGKLKDATTRTTLQLPTIYTIGFGLDFPDPQDTSLPSYLQPCSETDATLSTNITACLGQELLRYIADVGDNNQMDIDYQQDYLQDGTLNGITADSSTGPSAVQYDGYGDRGPCEGPIVIGAAKYLTAKSAGTNGVFSSNYDALRTNPLPPGSCGNYYNAPGGPQLTKVFEDIASRMFTRITK